MNKTQLLVLLATLLMAVLIVGISHGRNRYKHFIAAQTQQIGLDLIATTNSAKLVRIGPGLQGELTELLAYTAGVAEIRLGDVRSPIGDGRASSQLILTNAQLKRIGIRLRQDSNPERFHVLGYWNLRE